MVSSRPARLMGLEHFAGTGFRLWEMSVEGAWPPASIHAAVRPLVEQFAAEVHGDAGFVLVHAARPAFFVLAHVWDGVDLIQRSWTASLEAPTVLERHRDGAIGCVWELEVISAERERWAAVCERDGAMDHYLGASD